METIKSMKFTIIAMIISIVWLITNSCTSLAQHAVMTPPTGSGVTISIGLMWEWTDTDMNLVHISQGDTLHDWTFTHTGGLRRPDIYFSDGDSLFLTVYEKSDKTIHDTGWYVFHDSESGDNDEIIIEVGDDIEQVFLQNRKDSKDFDHYEWTRQFWEEHKKARGWKW